MSFLRQPQAGAAHAGVTPGTHWERFTIPVGVNLLGRMMAGGYPIANVQIDNLSGSWITINPGGFIIPPYTLGWATNLYPPTNSIDVSFTQGPLGTPPASTSGNPINVALYDTYLGNETGTAYLPTNPNSINLANDLLVTSTPFTYAIPGLAGTAGVRYQIQKLGISYPVDITGFYLLDANVSGIWLDDTSSLNLDATAISPSSPSDMHTYSDGLILPTGHGLKFTAACAWGSVHITVSATFFSS